MVLLSPSPAAYAALTLGVVMAGAATTHLLHDQMWLMDAASG